MEKTNLGDHMKEYKERIHSKTYKANTDLSLYSAGIEQCKSEYTYGPIVRSYYVMHFVFSGKGQLTINEHSVDVKAGDIFSFLPIRWLPIKQIKTIHGNMDGLIS